MKYIITISFILIFNLNSSAQNNNLNKEKNYFEELILNTNRDYFLAGETIQLNISCFDEKSSSDILSKILYVELFNFNKKSIIKNKYRIINGQVNTLLAIPENLASGNYYIRAYTKYLKNFSPELYPTKLISIYNLKIPYKSTSEKEDIVIEVEGGKLIKNKSSKIAVRISSEMNKKVSELSINNKTNKIKSQTAKTNGLYTFEITPSEQTFYTLNVLFKDSSLIERKIMPTLNNSYRVNTSILNSVLNLKIESFNSNLNTNNFKIAINSSNLNEIFYQQLNGEHQLSIPTSSLESGLIYISLLNEKNEIIYVKPSIILPNNSKIDISLDKLSYDKHEQIKINLNANNSVENEKFIIKIQKHDSLDFQDNNCFTQNNFHPNLLLNYINTENINSSNINEFNAYLIINQHYYNSDSFKNILKNENKLVWIPETRDLCLNGQLIDKKSNSTIQNKIIYASVLNEKQLHICKTDENGNFLFNLNHLSGIQNIALTTEPNDSIEYEILVKTDFSNQFPELTEIDLNTNKQRMKLIEELYINHQLKEVFSKYKPNKITNQNYFSVSNEYIQHRTFLKDFIKIPVLQEIFNEIIPSVFVRKNGDKFRINVFNEYESITYTEPLILINGLPYFNINKIMTFNPEFIESIDVINRPFYLGEYTIKGLVNIRTTNKEFMGIDFPNGSIFIDYQTLNSNSTNSKNTLVKPENKLPNLSFPALWKPIQQLNNQSIEIQAPSEAGYYSLEIQNIGKNSSKAKKTYFTIK